MTENINITVEFTGGLELLFDNVTKNAVSLSKDADNGNPPTVGYLVRYLCDHLMKDSRKELFVLDNAVYVNVREEACVSLLILACKSPRHFSPDQRLRLGT
ncbi:Ubiquitin-related modifier 1 [Exophiala xenobiotica]|nr:Ubiquitin-related modifier 1 [Exophiala xenobiotica]KAK5326703.1 Ubiquitin-related modifier 1 [Exophiala xenobiotica]KAK5407923.1 Ubiquitin-related modifier 1 [Exophiala xenobiotica]